MSITAKFRFALLIAGFLLVEPLSPCAPMAYRAAPPAHPCCMDPIPLPKNCLEPDCDCMNAIPLPSAVQANSDQGLGITMPEHEVPQSWKLAVPEIAAIERSGFATYHLFVTFHQLLI